MSIFTDAPLATAFTHLSFSSIFKSCHLFIPLDRQPRQKHLLSLPFLCCYLGHIQLDQNPTAGLSPTHQTSKQDKLFSLSPQKLLQYCFPLILKDPPNPHRLYLMSPLDSIKLLPSTSALLITFKGFCFCICFCLHRNLIMSTHQSSFSWNSTVFFTVGQAPWFFFPFLGPCLFLP